MKSEPLLLIVLIFFSLIGTVVSLGSLTLQNGEEDHYLPYIIEHRMQVDQEIFFGEKQDSSGFTPATIGYVH
jgi:hypothetical protein